VPIRPLAVTRLRRGGRAEPTLVEVLDQLMRSRGAGGGGGESLRLYAEGLQLSGEPLKAVLTCGAADLASSPAWFRAVVQLRKPTLQAMVEGWWARRDGKKGAVRSITSNHLVAVQSAPGGKCVLLSAVSGPCECETAHFHGVCVRRRQDDAAGHRVHPVRAGLVDRGAVPPQSPSRHAERRPAAARGLQW